jgi:hypothetical protein
MKLAYNFNLVKGDTFWLPTLIVMPWDSVPLRVDSIDNILLGNKIRKRIIFHAAYSSTVVWVEGIGDITYGLNADYGMLFYTLAMGYGTADLDCFTDNLQTTYGNCYYQSCFSNISVNNFNSSISIYPNPATNELNIEATTTSKIEIMNLAGLVIINIAAKEKNTTIDISTLAQGIYFVKLSSENGVAVKKFIIE